MITGRMYSLDNVLKINDQEGSLYLLEADGNDGCAITFGRNRRLYVSDECYIVTITDDNYELDKVTFEGGVCDYLKVLKSRNISYEIPKSLPESINRFYSRFACAVGYTHWSNNIRGYFGKNGYAILDVGYIEDDKYSNYEICVCNNPNAFHIGELAVTRITGCDFPKSSFVTKLLEEEVNTTEGDGLVAVFKDAGIWQDFDNIRFETKED